MSRPRVEPEVAADHLVAILRPPKDSAVSISTFLRPGCDIALRVLIEPAYGYLQSKVPLQVDGYDVLTQVADRAIAH